MGTGGSGAMQLITAAGQVIVMQRMAAVKHVAGPPCCEVTQTSAAIWACTS